MARSVSLAGLVLAGLLVAACSSSSSATPRPTPPAALPGTAWQIGLQGGTAPAATNPATLKFGTDGTLSGFDGCQTYSGAFTTSGSTIAITAVKTTSQQDCAPETATKATAFRTALGNVTTWQATDADNVPLPSGIKILSPVKLILTGPTTLAFSQG